MKNYIAIGVSGGVDSMVLLDQTISKIDNKNKILALYFDHNLRNSNKEKQLLETYCLDIGIKLIIGLNSNTDKLDENYLRNQRWGFFDNQYLKYHFNSLYLGHHKDDYIQTLIFNLIRGVDINGLFPMSFQFKPYRVIRPLLNLNKSQIYQHAISSHLEWIEDYSNILYSYTRNMIAKIINISENKPDLTTVKSQHLLDNIIQNTNNLLKILVEKRQDGVFFNYILALNNDLVLAFLLKSIIKEYFNISILDKSISSLVSIINKQNTGDNWHHNNLIAVVYSSGWLRLSIDR